MIKCLLDLSVPKDSKCANCCVYCDEQDCEYRCPKAKDEESILSNCDFAEEE